jgi:hypothetical protein
MVLLLDDLPVFNAKGVEDIECPSAKSGAKLSRDVKPTCGSV